MNPVPPSAALDGAAKALARGEAVIFPTDTVYGIGVAVGAAPGPEVLYAAKGRPASKPIPWLVASLGDLGRYGRDVPPYARQLAREGWPGALTLVVRASEAVPAAFCSAAGTVALRMPDHPVPLALAKAVGPLATTSANRSGDPQLAAACGGVLAGDGSWPCAGVPSSIVDCTGPHPRPLR